MYMDNRRLQQTARRSSIQTDVDTHVAMDNGHGTWTPPYSQRLRALSCPPILTNIITRISLLFPLLISFLSTIVFESDRNRTARSAVLPTRRGAARRRRALHGADTALARDGGWMSSDWKGKENGCALCSGRTRRVGLVWIWIWIRMGRREGGE
jgi:hypothetical protein